MQNLLKTFPLILLFLLPSSLIAKEKSQEEFGTKYEKSVDLEKVEERVDGDDVSAEDMDDSVQENAKESQTNLDFDNMSIDANYKAPTGFLITGKKIRPYKE